MKSHKGRKDSKKMNENSVPLRLCESIFDLMIKIKKAGKNLPLEMKEWHGIEMKRKKESSG
jgi:hypothetical protein